MSFGTGLAAFNDSLTLIRRPGVRTFVWVPAAISLVVIATGITVSLTQIDPLVSRLLQSLPDWLAFLDYLLTPLAYLVVVLLGTWLYGYVATFIASPFLGILAERVERELTGTGPTPEGSLLTVALAAVRREFRKLLYHLPRGLAVLVVTLLPLINVAAPLLWVWFGAWMVAVQYYDYTVENRGGPFAETLTQLRAERMASLGFGVPTLAMLSVPLLNFLAVPIAVVGGTILNVRLLNPQLDPEDRTIDDQSRR
jgi:CysZ protein